MKCKSQWNFPKSTNGSKHFVVGVCVTESIEASSSSTKKKQEACGRSVNGVAAFESCCCACVPVKEFAGILTCVSKFANFARGARRQDARKTQDHTTRSEVCQKIMLPRLHRRSLPSLHVCDNAASEESDSKFIPLLYPHKFEILNLREDKLHQKTTVKYQYKNDKKMASKQDPMTSTTKVINVKKKFLNQDGYVDFQQWKNSYNNHLYIGRNMSFYVPGATKSKWCNPFSIKKYGLEECLIRYEQHVRNSPTLLSCLVEELDKKVLGCWCHPNKCHGDILVKLLEEAKAAKQNQQTGRTT